jgi:hypothetical protein
MGTSRFARRIDKVIMVNVGSEMPALDKPTPGFLRVAEGDSIFAVGHNFEVDTV